MLFTWFRDPVQSMWQSVDEAVFMTLNASLLSNTLWQKTVAFANTKLYDKISTLFLVLMLLTYAGLGFGEDMGKRLAAAIFVGLYMLITTFARRELALLEYDRPSPTLVLEPLINLRDHYPDMKPKTEARNAFPSDHTISCLIFIALFWFYAGWKGGLAAILVSPAFIMPRMIGGAHWLTDSIIGSLGFSILAISWVLFTPLAGILCRQIYKPIQWTQNRLPPPLQDK